MIKKTLLLFSFLFILLISSQRINAQNQIVKDTLILKNRLTSKGNMYSGITFNFSTKDTDVKQGLLVDVSDQSRNQFKMSVDAGYFIKDNFALGALISFENDRHNQTETDQQGTKTAVQYAKDSYGIYGGMKNFIPLDSKRRFYLYNLVLLGTSFKHIIEERTTNDLLKRSYTKDVALELQINPGIMVNVVKGFSIEVGAQIAGFSSTWSKTTLNNEVTEKSHATDADFSINLLRLNIGFYYYFPIKKHSK
ncbi:hypothetical protein [Flavobacterium sp. ABG]|uniref:hypothetical protein n=1 Tax=Flavobacterium sp. ABG TaxID=1423322 RepID=UPI00064B141D|nr:hypothetical protein [Flavobacterium sp. ABG]KLT68250.1 hypothetical protein AB674_18675 [Flavobacterium sp. ABG]